MGKTVILSDLPVNIEQDPKYAAYFNRQSPEDLVRAIKEVLPTVAPGPDTAREKEGHIEAVKLVEKFGRRFCSIVTEAQFIYGKKIRGVNDTLWALLNEQSDFSESTETTAVFDRANENIDASDQGRTFNVSCPHCEAGIVISHKGEWQCPCCQKCFLV